MAIIEKLNGILPTDITSVNGILVADLVKFNGQEWPALGPYWQKVLTVTDNYINALAVDTYTANHNLVAGVGSLTPSSWYCNNGGRNTWVQSSEDYQFMTYVKAIIDQPTDNFMLAGCYNSGGTPYMHKSTDGGQTWVQKGGGAGYDSRGNLCFAYDPTSGYTFMGSSQSGKIWRTNDDGETFVEMQALSQIGGFVHTICYDSTNDVLIAGGGSNGADVWKSTNDGVTWVKKQEFGDDATPPGTVGVRCHLYSISHDAFHDTLIACAGADRGQIWVSDDAGETWTKEKDLYTDASETAVLTSVYDATLKRLWVGTQPHGELWYSDDGGYTWDRELQMAPDGEGDPGEQQIRCLSWDVRDGTIAFGTGSTYSGDGQVWIFADAPGGM